MSGIGDTIYALSSGALPSGVAVIRVSGPRVNDAIIALCGPMPPARTASLRWIRGRDGDVLDQGLVLYFPGPHSFTGEDCVEFQVHGGRAVVTGLLAELSRFPEFRHAEAGEFSRRAFTNGQLDLVQAEGLADLIAADTEMQRRLAMEQARGGLSDLYQSWAWRLTRIRAFIEADLDFSEEEDVPGGVASSLWADIASIRSEIAAHIHEGSIATIIRDGFKVVIAGRPNAGKSSLLNALAKQEIAIVTEVAGTTRDTISVDLNLGGYLVHLTDTAGLRDTVDVVEREGVKRAIASILDADLVLVLKDTMDPGGYPDIVTSAKVVYVRSKCDLSGSLIADSVASVGVSSSTGFGLDSLTKRILELIEKQTSGSSMVLPARARHRNILQKVHNILSIFETESAAPLELKAEVLREAAHALSRITGKVDVEDLLDVIFSEFCIGK